MENYIGIFERNRMLVSDLVAGLSDEELAQLVPELGPRARIKSFVDGVNKQELSTTHTERVTSNPQRGRVMIGASPPSGAGGSAVRSGVVIGAGLGAGGTVGAVGGSISFSRRCNCRRAQINCV